MATKIIDSYDLSGGDVTSTVLTDVADLVIDPYIASSNNKILKINVEVHEGDNPYTSLNGEDSEPIVYSLQFDSKRINIKGVDAEFCRLSVEVPADATGTLTIEATQTALQYT